MTDANPPLSDYQIACLNAMGVPVWRSREESAEPLLSASPNENTTRDTQQASATIARLRQLTGTESPKMPAPEGEQQPLAASPVKPQKTEQAAPTVHSVPGKVIVLVAEDWRQRRHIRDLEAVLTEFIGECQWHSGAQATHFSGYRLCIVQGDDVSLQQGVLTLPAGEWSVMQKRQLWQCLHTLNP